MAPGISVLMVSARALIFTSVLLSKMRLNEQGEEKMQEKMNKALPIVCVSVQWIARNVVRSGIITELCSIDQAPSSQICIRHDIEQLYAGCTEHALGLMRPVTFHMVEPEKYRLLRYIRRGIATVGNVCNTILLIAIA